MRDRIIVYPHKLCKIYTQERILLRQYPFFRVDELTSGQVNELIAIGGTEAEY